MTRSKAFQTAAARRRANPIVWTIDDTEVRLRATVDLADIADAIHEVQQPIAEGANQILAAVEKRDLLVTAIRSFVDPGSLAAFDGVAPDLDFEVLSDMLGEAIEEYTGTGNPTQEPPSSDGS